MSVALQEMTGSAAQFAIEDAGAAISALAHHLEIPCDPVALAAILGSASGTRDDVGALIPALACLGIEARRLRLSSFGTRAPWLTVVRGADGVAGLVVVLGHRGLQYEVALCRGGSIVRRRMRAARLAQAIGQDGSVEALVVGASHPLGAMHDVTHSMSPWRRVRRLLHIERTDIRVSIVYGLAVGVLSLVVPVTAQALVTTVAFGSVLQPLVVLTILFGLVSAGSGALRVMQAWTVEMIQQRLFGRAVADVARRLVGMPHSVLDRQHVPDLVNRFFEVPTIQKSLALLLIDGVGLVMQTVLGLALLAFYHPLLLAFAAVLVVALVFVVFGLGRGAVGSALEESKAKYEAVSWLEHLARIPTAFKSAHGRSLATLRSDLVTRRYLEARRRHYGNLLAQQIGGVAVAVIGSAAVLGLGGLLVIQNQLTLGQLVAAELIMTALSAAFVKLGKQLEVTYDLVQGATKLSMLVDLPGERVGGEPLPGSGAASFACHDLRFGYGDNAVLRRCNLSVPARSTIAIVGAGGSGRSSLLEVLAALRPPDGGSVELDGCDVRLLDLGAVRDAIVIVRDAQFVDGTLLENLRLGRDVPLADIEHVLDQLALAGPIRRLPDGLATVLQPRGTPLSTSATRRVALARALLWSPRVLLLDGALDRLGLEGDEKRGVLDFVLGESRAATIIVVTDDPDVIARCDRVCTLADGVLEAR